MIDVHDVVFALPPTADKQSSHSTERLQGMPTRRPYFALIFSHCV